MSVNDVDTSLSPRRFCQKQLDYFSSSSVHLRTRQLFFVLLLHTTVTTVVILVVWKATHVFDNATKTGVVSFREQDSAVVVVGSNIRHVFLVHDEGSDVKVAARGEVHTYPLATPPLMPLSTTTTTTTRPTTTSLLSSLRSRTRTLTPAFWRTTTTPKVPVDQYVSFRGGFADGRGLGNQMFDFAAVVYVAKLTNRKPAMLNLAYKTGLEKVFMLGIRRFDGLCPCYVFGEKKSLSYDRRLEDLVNGSLSRETRGKSIFISGFFQSRKYTQSIERQLRRHFTFLPEIAKFVDDFLAAATPPGWIPGYVRVGVHVRRGDVLKSDKVKFGYTTPDFDYFSRAMRYFLRKFDRIQFLVASNDVPWCHRNFAKLSPAFGQRRVNVTFVTGHSPGQDLALLASCEHVIMSTGSYGWWAAWLARGTRIYYSDWPKVGSPLYGKFIRNDFFPPTWIGMT